MGAAVPFIVPLIGAAASVGGGVMAGQAQQNSVDEQNRITQRAQQQAAAVRNAESARQADLQRQAAAASGAQVEQNTPQIVQGKIDTQEQQAAQPAETIASQIAALSPGATVPASSAGDNAQVNDDMSKRLAIASQNVRAYARPRSNLQAVGTVFNNIARDYNNTGDKLGLINNLRNSSLNTAKGEIGLVGQNYGADSIKPDLAYANIAKGLGKAISSGYDTSGDSADA